MAQGDAFLGWLCSQQVILKVPFIKSEQGTQGLCEPPLFKTMGHVCGIVATI